MTHEQILEKRAESKIKLIEYLEKCGISKERFHFTFICNGRNNLCEAIMVLCNEDEKDRKDIRQIFWSASNCRQKSGGEFHIMIGNRHYITIHDGWN